MNSVERRSSELGEKVIFEKISNDFLTFFYIYWADPRSIWDSSVAPFGTFWHIWGPPVTRHGGRGDLGVITDVMDVQAL